MRGYWKEPALTAAVLRAEGWFDTGDLGSLTPEGDLEFRGRAKETVVLRGGEKVEPQPLEERLRESPFIEQAVLVGADQKVLGALILPRKDAVEGEIRRRNGVNSGEAVAAADVEALIKAECARLLTEEAGFMAHERVARFALLEEPFTAENGLLTATLKLRRPAVQERYADRIRALFGE
jgi:long-chain acyl-CoA synthetase